MTFFINIIIQLLTTLFFSKVYVKNSWENWSSRYPLYSSCRRSQHWLYKRAGSTDNQSASPVRCAEILRCAVNRRELLLAHCGCRLLYWSIKSSISLILADAGYSLSLQRSSVLKNKGGICELINQQKVKSMLEEPDVSSTTALKEVRWG